MKLALVCWLLAQIGGDDIVARADRAYRAGDVAQAHALYGQALATPHNDRAHVLFQLGNSAHRLGRSAEAIWCYHRAARVLPRDAERDANLALLQARLGVEPPAGNLASALLAPLRRLHFVEQLGLACVLQAGGLIGFLLARRRSARCAAALLVGAGAALGVELVWRQSVPSPTHAIVLDAGGTLHAQAEATSAALLQLRPGEALMVGEMGERWLAVRHPMASGFVDRARVGIIGL
jgi:tetratricopeptide (TPR) repeat protein